MLSTPLAESVNPKPLVEYVVSAKNASPSLYIKLLSPLGSFIFRAYSPLRLTFPLLNTNLPADAPTFSGKLNWAFWSAWNLLMKLPPSVSLVFPSVLV